MSPVNFIGQVRGMYADGVRTFIEVGPGHVLSDLVQSILAGQAVETIALDASRGTRSGAFDLAVALCRLAALGHKVQLSRWENPPKSELWPAQSRSTFTIPISGANYRKRVSGAATVKQSVHGNGSGATPSASQAVKPRPEPQATRQTPAPLVQSVSVSQEATRDLSATLRVAEQAMLSLQKLQEQTAQLHHQFLENQDAARRTIESLLSRRREFLQSGTISKADALGSVPVTAPLVASVTQSKPAPSIPSDFSPPSDLIPKVGIESCVLKVVSEKTGYPAEMLNLEMGLDTDLGIDSIKRVEIMAALRVQLPDAPEIKPEHLGRLQTLREVVDFLSARAMKPGSGQEAPAPSTPDGNRVSQILIKVVAEKTGYPVEMLNLDMGLDADLGVDSIKRVEIMAAIRSELPSAPEIRPEQLGTLLTLQQIVEFLLGNPRTTTAESTPPSTKANSLLPDNSVVGQGLLEVVAEKTGYPVEMLNLDMGLDSDLGIDSIKRVEIMAAVGLRFPATPEIKPEQLGTLRTLGEVVGFLTSQPQKKSTELVTKEKPFESTPRPHDLQRRIIQPVRLEAGENRPRRGLPPGSCIWVTEDGSTLASAIQLGLEKHGYTVHRRCPSELIDDSQSAPPPSGLVILWPATSGDDNALKEAFRLIQLAGPHLRKTQTGKAGLLVSVSRLDGVFGFGSLNGKGEPTSGGLAGLVKTAHHEWPEVRCKAIDVNPEVGLGDKTADRIIEEMFRVGPVEVGLSGEAVMGLEMQTVPLAVNGSNGILADDDLVVVTGGGRGITAQTALRLARDHRLQLVLLGRSPLEESEPVWLSGLTSEAEIKKSILNQFEGGLHPKQLDSKFKQVLAQREIREQLRQIQATGTRAIYRSVDVRQGEQLQSSFQVLRQQFGPIRGLIHGAGVLADRRIEDKTEEQFDLVYGTKVLGLRNLLEAVADDELKLLALFSSYSGRFGRAGQADYAAANEVLNKIAQRESRRRPRCRVVSFNWGPWSAGMVSDGLRKVFEAEGVGLIDPAAGAEFFMREISGHSDRSVEVLALAPVSRHSANGNSSTAPGQASPDLELNAAFEKEVSVKSVPCLQSHVLNGKAVLPVALIVEWLAHGAIHGNPGMSFHGFQNFSLLKGLVLDPKEIAMVRILAAPGRMQDGRLCVPVELHSRSGSRHAVHARAEILLAEFSPRKSNSSVAKVTANGKAHPSVYEDGQLFHGHHFQGIEFLEACSQTEVAALVKGAPAPKHWIQNPLRPDWMIEPLALDCSFQMMILWTRRHRQAPSLPCAIRRFHQFVPAFPKNGTRVVIRVAPSNTAIVSADVDLLDREGNLLATAEGYECTIDSSLEGAFQKNTLA